jgi:hypothetical protein
MDNLIKRLRFDANDVRNHHSSTIANRINEAATALEAANARIADLETKCRLYEASLDKSDGRIAELEAQIAAADGWKLVPVEPTMEMVMADFESWPDPIFSKPEEWAAYEAMSGCQQAAHRARLCYAAMLAADPAAALAQQDKK